MRFSVSLLALLVASPALAEDVLVRADVAEAIVYGGLAEVVRRAELDLPSGQHRVIVPADIWDDLPPVARISAGEIGQIEALYGFEVQPGDLDTPAQAEARDALEAAKAARDAARAALEAANGGVRAAELQQAYLQSIVRGGEDGVAMPEDAATLAGILATLGAEMARAEAELHDARQTQRAFEHALQDAQEAVRLADRALQALDPWDGEIDAWAISVTLSEAGSVTLELDDVEEAAWSPSYDLHLDTETGLLGIDRFIHLRAHGWQDVAVTLATDDPFRSRGPSRVLPSRAEIREPQPLARDLGVTAAAEMAIAPMVEPVVVEDLATFTPLVQGLSARYPLPDPVTVAPDGTVILPFGALDLQAELINRAVPRRDATAFLIAEIENTTGEVILPGAARFFRDGALIGDGEVALIPEGAERELAFGPLDHLPLTWTDLSRDTGDRGVFVSSDTEERQVMVTVENLSGEAATLEVLYATPFSEQEDLEVEVSASVAPGDTAWEDLRGVYAWSLDLEPGEETEIRLGFDFSWPEGQALMWRP